jgi:hypothetical protein
MVCRACNASNWDGIAPDARPHLFPYLESQGIAVKLNANGCIDRPK